MPTDYSPLDALPAPQGGDIVRVSAFTDLRAAIDGKLVLTCTSATRPTGTARFTGRLIFETDTKAWGWWNGSTWVMHDTEWQTYTPSWTASGTAPSIGNGSITGKYLRSGRECSVHIALIAGSTTTFGSGQYFLSSPFAHGGVHSLIPTLGTAFCWNQGSWYMTGVVNVQTATTVSVFLPTSTTNCAQGQWSSTSPWTFKSTDQATLSYRFPMA